MFFNEEQLATLKNVCQPVVGFFYSTETRKAITIFSTFLHKVYK